MKQTDHKSDRNIMLDLLREGNGITFSWDWEMDLKFAERIGDEESANLLKELGGSVLAIREHDRCIRGKITKRRLRALRRLVKEGLVVSGWVGTGHSGYADFGVRRFREYELTERRR